MNDVPPKKVVECHDNYGHDTLGYGQKTKNKVGGFSLSQKSVGSKDFKTLLSGVCLFMWPTRI